MSTSFDDLVNQETKVDQSVARTRRRDEWLADVGRLYSTVEEYLSRYTEEGSVQVERTDKRMREDSIGEYDIQSLTIMVGSRRARLDPVGASVIGAKGRVDMVGPHGTLKLVLVPHTAAAPRIAFRESEGGRRPPTEQTEEIVDWDWKIATPPPGITYVDLGEEEFLDAVADVLDGS